MTMTVQPRHIKLALAGREQNWSYAAYELHEFAEAFERAARSWATWRSVPIAEMMVSPTKEPMAALAEAIGAAQATFRGVFGRFSARPSVASRRSISAQMSDGFTPSSFHTTTR
jgi:hypothetical protein